jgi:hypothetical protein
MNKVSVSLVLIMGIVTLAQAQPMVCEKKDYAGMSQKQLIETYCKADTANAGAPPTTVVDEHTAELQRQCLSEKGDVAKVLQQKFKLAPPACNPLIEIPIK